jgi:hypothetical protein
LSHPIPSFGIRVDGRLSSRPGPEAIVMGVGRLIDYRLFETQEENSLACRLIIKG